MARIQSGEVPDGSGDPLLPPEGPFLYKPGLSGGQIAYGGTIPGDDLEFHSGTVRDGLILFGASAAFDEANTRLGIGTIAPAAVLHLTQSGSTIYARPISFSNTVLGTHWTDEAGGLINLEGKVNEAVLDTGTYVTEKLSAGSGTGPITFNLWTAGTIPFTISPVVPTVTVHIITRRYENVAPDASLTEVLQFNLYRSAVLVKSQNSAYLSTTFQDFSYTLSAGEVSSLYNAGADTAKIDLNVVGLGQTGLGYDVAQIYLEISYGATTNLARWDTNSAQSGRITVEGYLESQRLNLTGTSSGTVTFSGGTSPANHTYTVPTAQGAASSSLTNDGAGALSWANPNLLSASHGDTLAGTVVRGDLIVGNSTPKWSRLGIGASGTILASNGTDAAWTASTALTSADFLDTAFRVSDDGNNTRKLAFQCSGISNSTTRTLTVPDRSSTIATLDGTQVFTGPSLTMPSAGLVLQCDDNQGLTGNAGVIGVINDLASALGMTIEADSTPLGSVASLTIPGAGGVVMTTVATQTVTNKTFSTGTTYVFTGPSSGSAIQDTTSSTKRFRIYTGNSASSTNNNLTVTTTGTRTLTMTDYTGNIVVVGNTTSAAGTLGTVNLTAQTGNIGATTLLTSSANSSGMFRVSFYLKTTTAGTAGSLVKVTVAFNDGSAQTADVLLTNLIATPAAPGINHDLTINNNASYGEMTVYSAASNAITFTTTGTYNTNPQYTLRARIETLG